MRIPYLLLIAASSAAALPEAAGAFCDDQSNSPLCTGRTVSCTLCHTAPPSLNGYGGSILGALGAAGYGTGPSFIELLPAAIVAIDGEDADADGMSNLEEVVLGSMPGDPLSVYIDSLSNSDSTWEGQFAFRRAMVAFCGKPPTRAELEAIGTDDGDATRAAVAAAAQACLSSDYWRDEALHRLADKRIRPVHAVGYDRTNEFWLGDYRYDYRLFSRSLTDDRDARELLLADDHVSEDGSSRTGSFNIDGSGGDLGQPLEPGQRAGMATTAWFLAFHTMFSSLPRTTAAQVYRSYLGQDIALSEGLRPVANEPLDVDAKGVAAPACARCHSTLDPMSYGFSYYYGIAGPYTGTFDPNLGAEVRAGVDRTETNTAAVFLGQNLDASDDLAPRLHGVRGLAQVAVESDDFARTVLFMLAEHAVGRTLTPEDIAELLPLLPRFRTDHNFSANRAVLDIVNTDAFGRP